MSLYFEHNFLGNQTPFLMEVVSLISQEAISNGRHGVWVVLCGRRSRKDKMFINHATRQDSAALESYGFDNKTANYTLT